VLGRNCEIAEGVALSGSIVWPDTAIAREARIADSIIGRACRIERNAVLNRDVLGDGTQIAEYSRL
jgi:NDP-sugar pyrophosphorylase family protein